ncbi:polysaccharide biosynthesis/export family protein [Sphingosinithalassobacter sp. CS137]|uniref:polysaccharide biosynthesis/export family protein n=1 Tax=Sphingosinithalassobacter sp. CS137 TaxID=2762748 RepID=UPI0021CFE392|nr:polysaccharide biosynthesis/export family protein [Sphingosinithalassobacter sp. CS137]
MLVMLSGCSSYKLIGREDLQVVSGGELPAPTRQDLILEQRSYVIGPFDKVTVDVYGVPELKQTVTVDASGVISLPLAGTVVAAGKTPSELADAIADQLRGRHLRDPQVIVNTDTVNQMITVDGEVQQPGLYPVTGRMTLLRTIATARGLSQFANSSYVVVFRHVADQDMAALYDLRAIRQGIYPDPEVYANDVVVVGESAGRRVFSNVISGSALLSAPLIALLQ